MKIILVCLVALFALTGCANVLKEAAMAKNAYLVASKTAVTTQKAGLLVSGYQAAYSAANQYLALGICAKHPQPCRDKDTAAKINAVLNIADPRARTLIADIKIAKAQCKAAALPDDKCTIPVLAEAYNLLFASKNDLVAATPATTMN